MVSSSARGGKPDHEPHDDKDHNDEEGQVDEETEAIDDSQNGGEEDGESYVDASNDDGLEDESNLSEDDGSESESGSGDSNSSNSNNDSNSDSESHDSEASSSSDDQIGQNDDVAGVEKPRKRHRLDVLKKTSIQFRCIAVPINSNNSISIKKQVKRPIYLVYHQQAPTDNTLSLNSENSLIVANLPMAATEAIVRETFQEYGHVETVKLNPVVGSEIDQYAVVSFDHPGIIQDIMGFPKQKLDLSHLMSLGSYPVSQRGPQAWFDDLKEKNQFHQSVTDLRAQADQTMAKFEAEEKRHQEMLASQRNQVGEDGFMMVVDRSKLKRQRAASKKGMVEGINPIKAQEILERQRAKERKRKKNIPVDFYGLKRKIGKVRKLENLRTAFEKDKEKVARAQVRRQK